MNDTVKALEMIGSSFDKFSEASEKSLKNLADRLESLEAANDKPHLKGGNADNREVKTAIEKYLRKGDKSGLMPYQVGYEEKDMAIGTPSAGGYTHVPQLATEIMAAIGESIPLFADVNQVETDSNEYQQIFTTKGPSAARAAESGTRNAGTGPRMARVDVGLFDLYAYVPITNELLDSSRFDVAAYLQSEVQRQFEASIETELVDGAGSGSNEALGILTQATSELADFGSPERSFSLYQYLNLGINSPLSSFNYDSLVTLSQALPIRYRKNAKFYASTGGIETMRKLKDTENHPIWLDAQGGVSGRPQSILGYEVVEAPALPAVAAGNKPVIFGDLKQGYLWATHERGLRVIRDDVTSPGLTKFYVSLQCGGKPGDTRAVKALRIG